MPTFQGFLVSSIRYADSDAILNLYTKESGFESFFVKGIYTQKSKKKSFLFPFNLLEISVYKLKSGTISTVSDLELVRSHYQENDMKTNCILMFASDFLSPILKNENENEILFSEINYFLHQVQSQNINAHLALAFNILQINGLLPLISTASFLNPESGKFEAEKSHQLFDEKISEIWKTFLISKNTYEVRLSRSERNEFLESMIRYYHFHFENFRFPESLEILKQIFD